MQKRKMRRPYEGWKKFVKYRELFEKLQQRCDLSVEESKEAVNAMMQELWTPEQTSSFLTALHEKEETADEIIGFAVAMRERALPVNLNGRRVLDTCGTGGDRKRTFNISTIAAFVLAGCGIPVVKHGNRAASSACGSADLLQSLGISHQLLPEQVLLAIEETHFAFLFAPHYHPATKAVASVRKQLGIPTIFNLLGPLTNPALPHAQIIGVYKRGALPLLEAALRKMDPQKRAMLIHSTEGHDEATVSCEFHIYATFGQPTTHSASMYGFEECSDADLLGGSPMENAQIAMNVLSGENGSKRETVLLNAALGYLAYYPTASIDDARGAVYQSVDSGAALRVVRTLQERFPA